MKITMSGDKKSIDIDGEWDTIVFGKGTHAITVDVPNDVEAMVQHFNIYVIHEEELYNDILKFIEEWKERKRKEHPEWYAPDYVEYGDRVK